MYKIATFLFQQSYPDITYWHYCWLFNQWSLQWQCHL